MEKYDNFIYLLQLYMGRTTLFSELKLQQISSQNFTELFKEIMNNEETKEEIGIALMDLHEALETIRNLYTGDFDYDILLEGSNGKLYQGSFNFQQLKDYGLIQFSNTGRMNIIAMEDQLNEMIMSGTISEFKPSGLGVFEGKTITKTEFLNTMASKLGAEQREDLLATRLTDDGEIIYKNFNAGWAFQWYRALTNGTTFEDLSYENLTGYAGADTVMGQEKVATYSSMMATSKVGIAGLYNMLVSTRSYLGYIPQMEEAQDQLFTSLIDFKGSDQGLYQSIINEIMDPLLTNNMQVL